MNLAFNFHDKLFWIHNFLPEHEYKRMNKNVIKIRNSKGMNKTKITWRKFKEEEEDNSYSFGQNENGIDPNFFFIFHTLLKYNSFIDFKKMNFHSHIRKFEYGNHLGWHNDSNDEGRKYAVTYYFNKTWHESWGGEFMFKSNLGSGFIPIKGNSVVIVESGLKHKVNSNLKKTHPRLSIQTWVSDKGDNNEINTEL